MKAVHKVAVGAGFLVPRPLGVHTLDLSCPSRTPWRMLVHTDFLGGMDPCPKDALAFHSLEAAHS